MKTGKAVLSTLAILAVGAIAGFLFAPTKERKSLNQSMDADEGAMDEIQTKYNKPRDTISKKFENTRKNVEETFDQKKANYDSAKQHLKNAVSNFKHERVEF